jgi:hypothetical protein
VTITAEQERQFIADLEKRGETRVRSDLEHGRIPEPFHDIVHRWLSERERSRETDQSAQAEAAIRASAAAERAASAAERQAREAERANRRATIAIIIAIASAIIATLNIVITYWPAHK